MLSNLHVVLLRVYDVLSLRINDESKVDWVVQASLVQGKDDRVVADQVVLVARSVE